ncbi:ATP-dependent Clp protease proteolytic subunit [Egibacter rhizosphaerae]|uniref:ATP-dependent Clp protease proteolytic subunit n=1 Tax=Egibacter rhizosphaerae TaxID=1670831 RepID=A0A411YJ64_9ACTN|nr:ATP-dependent Clp protease proteolytic subunit [Egibacter rhizosphaerae]QBI21191.1 ATP-dependent Clp protease proteolytic subunit [Egibacter rhizosphaerae]
MTAATLPIPSVVEAHPRGDRATDVFSRLLSERVVFLGDQVDDTVANIVVAQLLHLHAADPDKEVALYVNSPGGSVTAGLAILDTMRYVSCPVRTVCIGQAASIAAVILACGSPARRLALPHSRVLLHQPWGQARGQASDLQGHADEFRRLRALLWELLGAATGRDATTVAADADRDLVLPAARARAYGLVDEVVETAQAAPARAA